MSITWKNNASLELATLAATAWGADIDHHISDSGNSVWLMRRQKEQLILRLTDPFYRTFGQSTAELNYVEHLIREGIQVAQPIPTEGGEFVVTVELDGEKMFASAFTYALGERVSESSPHWNDNLFLEWGRTLGKIHVASGRYENSGEGDRWLWHDEIFLAYGRDLIPADDTVAHHELETVLTFLEQLPRSDETFGMTHGDFAPQNFHYHPTVGIMTFDFGNCCYHWYLSDIAISFTRIRHLPNGKHLQDLILQGYREHREINLDMLGNINWFFRLRTLYIYLSRLMKYGSHPTDEERGILASLQNRVNQSARSR
ncbi:MAG: phosphotransferase enzyme family protein [Candidatus Kapaibacterium sp.]